ncbi:hypothetical protein D3C78_1689830 [compost metagenome]
MGLFHGTEKDRKWRIVQLTVERNDLGEALCAGSSEVDEGAIRSVQLASQTLGAKTVSHRVSHDSPQLVESSGIALAHQFSPHAPIR